MSDWDNIIKDVCKAYFRPIYGRNDYDGTVDYDNPEDNDTNTTKDCNKDMVTILNNPSKLPVMFFLDTDVRETHRTFYLVMLTPNEADTFKGEGCPVKLLGKVFFNDSAYEYTTSDLGTISYRCSITNGDSESCTFNFTIEEIYTIDNTGKVDGSCRFTPLTQSLNSSGHLVPPPSNYDQPVYSGSTLTDASSSLMEFVMAAKEKDVMVVDQFITDTIINLPTDSVRPDGYPTEVPANMIRAINTTIGSGIPADTFYNYDAFNIVFGSTYTVTGNGSSTYSYNLMYFKVTSKSLIEDGDTEGKNFTIQGEFGVYGGSAFQNARIKLHIGNDNKITMEPSFENGFYCGNFTASDNTVITCTFSVDAIYALILDGKITDPGTDLSNSEVLGLLYPEKSVTPGKEYWYMTSASQLARDMNSAYSQFNYTYKMTGTPPAENADTDVNALCLVFYGNNAMYRFSDTVEYSHYSGKSVETKSILESPVTVTAGSTEYENANIRFINDNYYLLPDSIASVPDGVTPYYTVVNSDLQFGDQQRYPDLQYFVSGNSTSVQSSVVDDGNGGSAVVISVKGGNTPYLCTLEERSLFVSMAYEEELDLPSYEGSYVHPVSFKDESVIDDSLVLDKYNRSFIPDGADLPTTATTLTNTKDTLEILKQNNSENTDFAVYLQIPLTNVDIYEGVAYFDTDTVTAEGDQRTFYLYLIIRGFKDENYFTIDYYYSERYNKNNEFTASISDDKFVLTGVYFASLVITFKSDSITVLNYQEFFPANMKFASSALSSDGQTVENTITDYEIMAVYKTGTVPPLATVTSSVVTYSNKCYLEEYNPDDYNKNLFSLLPSDKEDITEDLDVDWTLYSEIILSYVLSKSGYKSRLFTVSYKLEKAGDKCYVKELTLYKFANIGETSLSDCVCQKIDMDKEVAITGSSFKADVQIKFENQQYELAYEDYWYNHFEGSSPNATIVSLFGIPR